MKTYDEYIQARIFKVYLENKNGRLRSGALETFDSYAKLYCGSERHDAAGWLMAFGCGKLRAKYYARYIKKYLERVSK